MRPQVRILLVEDEPALRLVVRVALEKIGGFQVHCCASGREALEVLDEFNPELLLLDVMMPLMDGPSTLRAIRQAGCTRAPAVFLTAKVQPREVDELMQQGAIGVLRKPFDPRHLSDEIVRLWEAAHSTGSGS